MLRGDFGTRHEPVLAAEVVRLLAPAPGKLLGEATVGTGGHAEALLLRGAEVVGTDQDPEASEIARKRLVPFGERLRLVRGNFRRLQEHLTPLDIS